jgi:glycine oxidase
MACSRLGVSIRPGCPALGFVSQGDRVLSVKTAEGNLPCGSAVVAAGAWTEGLLSGLGHHVPTPPVLGQIVLLRARTAPLRRIVEHGARYLVPRDDGRVLVGSTEESAGFQPRTTAGGVMGLIAEAIRLCPGLADAEFERAWSGLRPGSLDHRPYLGPLPGFNNLFVASGHKRAGLQLSPGTAVVLADLVMGRTPSIDLSPFRIDRDPSPSDEPFRS